MSLYVSGGDMQATATPVKTRPRVLQRVDELRAIVELLDKNLNELADRISPVSVPAGPDSNEKNAVAQDACPLADNIAGVIRHVGSLNSRVEDMISRLEV